MGFFGFFCVGFFIANSVLIRPPPLTVNYNCVCSDLDALVESLNPRGLREGELRDRIIAEREGLERRLGNKRSAPTRLWLAKEEAELAEDDRRLAEGVLKRREKNAKAAGGVALPLGTSLQDVMELALRLV